MQRFKINLKDRIEELYREGRPGLSLFFTAGFPDTSSFVEIIKLIDKEKLADFLEIGIPFSDPVADGPLIQRASEDALAGGANLKDIIVTLKELYKDISIPMVMMSYLNPLISYGIAGLKKDAAAAGFQAFIVPDLPIEESDILFNNEDKVDVIFLAAPSSSSERIREISKLSSPFLYYVSRFGITGIRSELSKDIDKRIEAVKKNSLIPVYCGFGISGPEQAQIVSRSADGVIIGSALTRIIYEHPSDHLEEIRKFAINVRKKINRKGR